VIQRSNINKKDDCQDNEPEPTVESLQGRQVGEDAKKPSEATASPLAVVPFRHASSDRQPAQDQHDDECDVENKDVHLASRVNI
jgi:hypothetical protein